MTALLSDPRAIVHLEVWILKVKTSKRFLSLNDTEKSGKHWKNKEPLLRLASIKPRSESLKSEYLLSRIYVKQLIFIPFLINGFKAT